MRGRTAASFPNPVLSPDGDDYVDSCRFVLKIDEEGIDVDEESILIPVGFELDSRSLSLLVDEGKAVVAVSAKSPSASFSKLSVFDGGSSSMVLKIEKFSVLNRIDIEGVIIASAPFRLEGSEDLNSDYFVSEAFEIRKGDILAADVIRCIYVDDSELEQPLTSIFVIRKGDKCESKLVPDFADEKIVISLSEDLFGLYSKFVEFNNGVLARYVTGLIVLPVLAEAVAIVSDQKNDVAESCEERRWYRALEKKAEAKGIEIHEYQDSAVTLADRLLGDVSCSALRQFEEVFEAEFNNGEMEIIGGVD